MTTKLELSQLLAARNAELCAARLRISVLEGELALRPRTAPSTAGAARADVKRYTDRLGRMFEKTYTPGSRVATVREVKA